jgi:mono/diheme cytochrome c family protein
MRSSKGNDGRGPAPLARFGDIVIRKRTRQRRKQSESDSVKAAGLGILLIIVAFGAAGTALAWERAIAPVPSPMSSTTMARQSPAGGSFDQALVADGARLAALGNCTSCHTASGGRPYAGGRALKTPFGVLYATNITPDAETGIGTWSLAAFRRAMRTGVARDGHLLYPAFPYTHFTHMTDEDIAAVYAFMMTRAPVQANPPPNRLIFPLGFRPLIAGWNALYLQPGALALASDPARGEAWHRGRYLVESVAHCAACHTPRNALGAERSGLPFAGGRIDGWDAPPLTALSAPTHTPAPWSKAQLIQYLRTGLAPGHGAAAGPMTEVTRSLAHVPEADVAAIAEYLAALPPVPGTASADQGGADSQARSAGAGTQTQSPADAVPATNVASGHVSGATSNAASNAAADAAPARAPLSPELAAQVARGAVLFEGSCTACHGSGAPMSTLGARPSLSLSTAVNAPGPRNTLNVILAGIPYEGNAGPHFMPPFSATLTDAQIADLAQYLRVRFTTQPAWPALEKKTGKLRQEGNPS